MSNILNYKIFGSGPPVVILHGLFGMLDNWFSFAKSLQEEYQCILVDQRNHGRSFHDEKMDYTLMAEDVLHLLNELDLEKVNILGHSMGGKTAMQFALSYPDRTAKLAVLDIAPKLYQGDHDQIFAAMKALDVSAHQSRSALQEGFLQHLDDPSTAAMLLKNIARTPEGFSWRFGLHEIHQGYENLRDAPSGSPYQGPTLFVRGESSPYIKDEDAIVIRQFFPNAQLKDLLGAGHWVHVDAPDELKEMLSAFFQGH